MTFARIDGGGRWIRGVVLMVAMAAGLSACGAAAPDPEPAPAAAPQAVASADSRSARGRPVALVAEGTGDAAWVLPPAVPPLPPGVEFRARYTYPAADDDDLLDVQVFLTGTGAPTGLPIAPGSLISHFRMRVDRFQVSRQPEPNLLITGTVKSTPVPSPFGAIAGRLVAITAGFTEGATTTFTMLGGPVAGSHATFLPVATGSITFAGKD
jgi:hypothetical protein